MKDPTELIRLKASKYPNVGEGTSCTQSSFMTGGKAFLLVGEQGGRYKAMLKLKKSKAEAARPKKLWQKWLDESYRLSQK